MAKAMARHILVKTEAEAAQFDLPVRQEGGDLGEVRPGQMVRSIDQVIFKKSLRDVHGPIKSQFGYHLVQVFYRD